MVKLPRTLEAWNTSTFKEVLVKEVSDLGLEHLPLQQGLSQSSVALDHNLKIIVLHVEESGGIATLKLGAFYSGIVAGCSCADDPTPVDEISEYCELMLDIDLSNGETSITLVN